jgi:hypothetical protein
VPLSLAVTGLTRALAPPRVPIAAFLTAHALALSRDCVAIFEQVRRAWPRAPDVVTGSARDRCVEAVRRTGFTRSHFG